ncbi:hypothetical protein EGR_08372 [Echinococcus granulosus]|uniref:Uncharacterized protein n=1 Tax=Echinococcus granulosus TaxID=6210 RepID=W6UTQ4_ECHGR|nr:hypothetical protein EGR_08372 [Echinococcus granulosus]EUB56794.1 hypothetical protein EGR_08372 [Echinococcus granulosus]
MRLEQAELSRVMKFFNVSLVLLITSLVFADACRSILRRGPRIIKAITRAANTAIKYTSKTGLDRTIAAPPMMTNRRETPADTAGKQKPESAPPIATTTREMTMATTGKSNPATAHSTVITTSSMSTVTTGKLKTLSTPQASSEMTTSQMSLLSPSAPLHLFSSLFLLLASYMLI